MPKLPVPARRSTPPPNPEVLYDTLKGTDAGVRHLWAHQADALRTYYDAHRNSDDVALEFPTGAGKTLVGALIGEWRRRALRERVAFVCPTNQLANQAAQKAHSYGIDVVLLIGSHRNWSPADVNAFTSGTKLAVTNYHHIFNSDPKVDAQTLIFDDAHAGEPAVAGRWTVEAGRETALYVALRDAIEDTLPDHVARLIHEDGADPRVRNQVELVPPTAVARRHDQIAQAINEHVESSSPASYAWTTVSSGLSGCLMYVSWSGIALRPLVSPTATLQEFAGANQRVYMSATLGQAGELERSFGVARIERIPLPRGWERQGSGRRLVIFPSLVNDADVPGTVQSALSKAGRSLVIAPSDRQAAEAAAKWVPEGMPELGRDDVGTSFDAFTQEDHAALVLANRYDGMDLPDDACRLVLLHGLPFGTHLQERFLFDTLSAREALDERIRTRVTQGMGRATRNRQDFAAVLLLGRDLISFISREEVRGSMRPELQAELELGLQYADDDVDMLDALSAFYEQGEDWRPVEDHLREVAEELTPSAMPGSDALSAAAQHEVRAWTHVWRGDFAGARDHGQEASRMLVGGAVKQYRALWRYLVASWAQLVAESSGDERDARIAAEARRDAENAFGVLPWFPRFEDQVDTPVAGPEYVWRTDRAAQWLDRYRRGPRLQKKLEIFAERIGSDSAADFELGLETLGAILGFESVRPNQTSDPDGIWREGTETWLVWEAKTMEHGDAPLPVKDVRQANTHYTWTKRHLMWPEPSRSATVVVCQRDDVHPDVEGIADEGVTLTSPAVVRDIADRATTAIRIAANEAPALSADQLRDRLGQLFAEHRLSTDELLQELAHRSLAPE